MLTAREHLYLKVVKELILILFYERFDEAIKVSAN